MTDSHDEADRYNAIRARARLEEILAALIEGAVPLPLDGVDRSFVRLIASLEQVASEEQGDQEAVPVSTAILSSLTLDYIAEILEEAIPLIRPSSPPVQTKFHHALDRALEQFGH